jgi:periplasmic copper chaperone A
MLNKVISILGLMMLACCAPPAPAGGIKVENARISAPAPGAQVVAAYFTLRNEGAADQLVSVSTPAAASAELHMTKNDAGMMSMHRMSGVDLPAAGVVEFAPGGMHVMLIGPKADLAEGAQAPITFTFAQAAPLTVMFTVRGP